MTFTELRGGLLVRSDALLLALRLESDNHVLTAKDGQLLVSNGSSLTADDRAQIKQLKNHLMALAGYEAPEMEP